jgi:hypothetical protein
LEVDVEASRLGVEELEVEVEELEELEVEVEMTQKLIFYVVFVITHSEILFLPYFLLRYYLLVLMIEF